MAHLFLFAVIGVDKDGNLFYTLLLNKTPGVGGVGNESVVVSGVSEINITTEPTNVREETFNQEVHKLADKMARLDDIYPVYTGETITF